MTGSRTNRRPCPNYLRHHGLEKAHNHTHPPPPASADSMHRAGPASRPFVLATLRALRLDPAPLPDAARTRRPKASQNHWSTTCLTEPAPQG